MIVPPNPVRPRCECTTIDVLEGTQAMAYAGHHLRIALGAALTILPERT